MALGLFGKRGGAAILGALTGREEESSGTKTEIHNHYYQAPSRVGEETAGRPSEAPEPRVIRRKMRRDPPRTLDLNPYDDDREHEHEHEPEKLDEVKP